ncbi:Semaphorin-5A [Cichlidogyrus casuarinus]|uniref:Semaphorin-5A n=1 Tax=Cichlidogyrus casuarinus TaxID=1844966 RepID=A0ABD2QBI8_9PLAT
MDFRTEVHKDFWTSVENGCPTRPGAVSHWSSDRTLYSGAVLGSWGLTDAAIVRLEGAAVLGPVLSGRFDTRVSWSSVASTLRTESQSDWIKWTDDTNFVGAFESLGAVYIVFVELAEETTETCKTEEIPLERDVSLRHICPRLRLELELIDHPFKVATNFSGYPKALSFPLIRDRSSSLLKQIVPNFADNHNKNRKDLYVGPRRGQAEATESIDEFPESGSDLPVNENTPEPGNRQCDERVLYVTFSTDRGAPLGSVVCEYAFSDIEKAFFDGLLYDKEALDAPPPSRITCNSKWPLSKDQLEQASTKRLLLTPIVPRKGHYIARADNELWTSLVVDRFFFRSQDQPTTNRREMIIIFVTTSNGLIRKYRRWSDEPGQHESCLVETISIIDRTNNSIPRSDYIFSNLLIMAQVEKRYLVATTKRRLYKLPLSRCGYYGLKNRETCQYYSDPYCSWNEKSGTCWMDEAFFRFSSSDAKIRHEFERSVSLASVEAYSKCLIEEQITKKLEYTLKIDGGWSSWGSWSPSCKHVISSPGLIPNKFQLTGCECRKRLCDSPKPFGFLARVCSGESIQVRNCFVNGGWTPWSQWGACKPITCSNLQKGFVKIRNRWCMEPPKLGEQASSCVGPDSETETCDPDFSDTHCAQCKSCIWSNIFCRRQFRSDRVPMVTLERVLKKLQWRASQPDKKVPQKCCMLQLGERTVQYSYLSKYFSLLFS